jgi:hypothetical protein
VDLTTAQAQAQGVAPTISREGEQHPTFSRPSQNMATVATLLDTLPAPSTDGVDKLYGRLGEIIAIATAPQVECSL